MRHPFDGIPAAEVAPLPQNSQAAPVSPTRRTALGRIGFAIGGFLGLCAHADAQVGATTKAFGEEGGKVKPTTLAVGEEGGQVMTRALNEQGIILTQAKGEGWVAPTMGMQEQGMWHQPVSPYLTTAWNYLAAVGSTPGTQHQGSSDQSRHVVEFLAGQFQRDALPVEEQRVTQHIQDLDSRTFKTREAATKALLESGPGAIPLLEKVLPSKPSLEVMRRVEDVLAQLRSLPILSRAQHGLQLLVILRTPEARQLLEKLASGQPATWLSPLAMAALQRIGR